MREQKPFNLFVYGTLMNPSVFRAVLGRELVYQEPHADGLSCCPARNAVLPGYKKVSPDNTYLYAVPDPHGRIQGCVAGPLPGESMAALRRYEGRNYAKRTVRVQTQSGPVRAVVFVANLQQLQHAFGYAFRDHFKQEVLLEGKIERALLEAEQEQLHTTEETARRAVAELRGDRIRDLQRQHFEVGGISDYVIRWALKEHPLRDFTEVVKEPAAAALAENYLTLAIRQVLFNQLEERIRRDFRHELDHVCPPCLPRSGRQAELQEVFYERTVSSLAALRMLNARGKQLDAIVGDCLGQTSFHQSHLIDFVKSAVAAADRVYESRQAAGELTFIGNHMGHGCIALGAELEFSNTGHNVIRDPQAHSSCDRQYDGFFYFADFGLDILTWKLGGHIDDHYDRAATQRRRGFFEVALGSLSIEADLSKPLTDDPWLMNQLIHETQRFFDIRPHSLHISLQFRTRHRHSRDRLLPAYVMKCLFAIAGDPQRPDQTGRHEATARGPLQIERLASDEIIGTARPDGQSVPHLMFSDISRRHSSASDGLYPTTGGGRSSGPDSAREGRYVQQFKFLRLSPRLNYEPIILALKGIQLDLSPGSFLTPTQYTESAKHRKLFEELLACGEIDSWI